MSVKLSAIHTYRVGTTELPRLFSVGEAHVFYVSTFELKASVHVAYSICPDSHYLRGCCAVKAVYLHSELFMLQFQTVQALSLLISFEISYRCLCCDVSFCSTVAPLFIRNARLAMAPPWVTVYCFFLISTHDIMTCGLGFTV
jgi:hypothetical protein